MAEEKSLKSTLGKIANFFSTPEVKELVKEETTKTEPRDEIKKPEIEDKIDQIIEWQKSLDSIEDEDEIDVEQPKEEEEVKEEIKEEAVPQQPEIKSTIAEEVAELKTALKEEMESLKKQNEDLQQQLDNAKPQGLDHNPEIDTDKSADFAYKIKTDATFRRHTNPTQRVYARAAAMGIKGAIDASK